MKGQTFWLIGQGLGLVWPHLQAKKKFYIFFLKAIISRTTAVQYKKWYYK